MKKVILLSLAIGIVLAAAIANTGNVIPQTISYQGYLKNGSGTPITGTVSMTFEIYSGTQVLNEDALLHGSTSVTLAHSPLLANSELVTSLSGNTTYSAATDYQMTYPSGQIARRGGTTIPNHSHVLVSYVYNASSVWSETQSAVHVKTGIYNVLLGSVTSLPTSDFAQTNLFLRITMGAEVLNPVVKLSSVAFAYKADTANSADSVPSGTITSAMIVDGTIGSGDVGFNYAGSSSKGGQATDSDLLDGLHSAAFALVSHSHPFSQITGIATDVQVSNTITVNMALDSDKVDGLHAAAFALVSHTHPNLVAVAGDTMTGPLQVPQVLTQRISSYGTSSTGFYPATWDGNVTVPFYASGRRSQTLFLAGELPSGLITNFAVHITGSASDDTYNNFGLWMAVTSLTALGTTFDSNYDAGTRIMLRSPRALTIPASTPDGYFDISLDRPFYWDGTKNLVIEMNTSDGTASLNSYRKAATSRQVYGNYNATTGTVMVMMSQYQITTSNQITIDSQIKLTKSLVIDGAIGFSVGQPLSGTLWDALTNGGATTLHTHSFSSITGSVTDAQVPDNITITLAQNSSQLNGQAASYYLNATNINAGTLGNGFFSAYSDLGVEGYLDNSAGGDLITQSQGDGRYSLSSHSHSFAQITGTATDAQIPDNITITLAQNSSQLNGQAASYYLNATNINAGTLAEARIDSLIARDSEVMTIVLANDGTGSLLDADLLDGLHSSSFATSGHTHAFSAITGRATDVQVSDTITITLAQNSSQLNGQAASFYLNATNINAGTLAEARIDPLIARDSEVMTIVLANDGTGSLLDADLLDGLHSSAFATSGHTHAFSAITGRATDVQVSDTITITLAQNSNQLGGQLPAYYRSATNINAGNLDPAYYQAYADLTAEGYLDNSAPGDLLTQLQGDGRYSNISHTHAFSAITGSVTDAQVPDNITITLAQNSSQLNGQAPSYYLNATNINAGTLGTNFFSAQADLGAEGYLDNNADTDILTRLQGDGRYSLSSHTHAFSAITGSVTDAQVPDNITITLAQNSSQLNGQAPSYYLNATNINAGTLGNTYYNAYNNMSVAGLIDGSTGTDLFTRSFGDGRYVNQWETWASDLTVTGNLQVGATLTVLSNIVANTAGKSARFNDLIVSGTSEFNNDMTISNSTMTFTNVNQFLDNSDYTLMYQMRGNFINADNLLVGYMASLHPLVYNYIKVGDTIDLVSNFVMRMSGIPGSTIVTSINNSTGKLTTRSAQINTILSVGTTLDLTGNFRIGGRIIPTSTLTMTTPLVGTALNSNTNWTNFTSGTPTTVGGVLRCTLSGTCGTIIPLHLPDYALVTKTYVIGNESGGTYTFTYEMIQSDSASNAVTSLATWTYSTAGSIYWASGAQSISINTRTYEYYVIVTATPGGAGRTVDIYGIKFEYTGQ